MSTWVPLAIGLAVIVLGSLVPAARARSRRRELAEAKTRARARYHELGFGVETISAGGDAVAAANALSKAEERWHTTGALLADADTTEECLVAERVAEEGLALLDEAGRHLGIDRPKPV